MSRFGRRSDLRGGRTALRKSRGLAFTVSDLEQRTMLSVTTGLVSDINQLDANPTNMTDVNGKLYYTTQDSSQGTASLWTTDGTAQGSVELATIEDSSYGLPGNSPPFVSQNGLVYFMGSDSSGNQGLFKTDGTVAGTALVAPITGGGNTLAAVGGKIFFNQNGINGDQLWASDGTASGTTKLSSSGSLWAFFGSFAVSRNSIYFTGRRRWRETTHSSGPPTVRQAERSR